jgi:hypothetical protein
VSCDSNLRIDKLAAEVGIRTRRAGVSEGHNCVPSGTDKVVVLGYNFSIFSVIKPVLIEPFDVLAKNLKAHVPGFIIPVVVYAVDAVVR